MRAIHRPDGNAPLRGPVRAAAFVLATLALGALSLDAAASDTSLGLARISAPSNVGSQTSAATPTPDVVTGLPSAPPPMTTSCTDVIHLGDSTSVGLVSSSFLPDADDRLAARYKAVGITNFIPEISGARSMVETLHGQPNATTVATRRRDAGYRGCWVLALGTNDPANVGGDVAALTRRIDGMMKRAGTMPVLWSTSKTLVTRGPYKNENMEGWNRALRDACGRYPNMRVYDWAAEVKDGWFMADGIHPNSAGCKAKAAGFAAALASAFPSGRSPASSCFVRSKP